MAPILGIYASQISGHLFAPSGAYDSIATVTVGAGGAATITFSSIPSNYTHLQLRATMLTTSASNIVARFNSDNAANYTQHQLVGDGSSASAGANVATNSPYFGYTNTQPGVMIVDILDYKDTNKYTTSRILTGSDANGAGIVLLRSAVWMNTAAVNQIDVTVNGGANFNQYSQVALYGVKGQ